MRPITTLSLALSLALALTACDENGTSSTGQQCSGAADSGSECEGETCIILNQNAQGKSGICSENCSATFTCQHGGQCLGAFPDGQYYCMQMCTSNSDCDDGFICYDDPGVTGSYCWVEVGGGSSNSSSSSSSSAPGGA